MRRTDGGARLRYGQENTETFAGLVEGKKKARIVVTHNAALKDMADKVIRIKSGKIESVETNDNPTSVEEIEW